MTQSPYHRVEFNVHNNNQTTSIKLALKPEFTLKDALTQVRNVWTAETKHSANLAAINLLSVKDSEGFWLPQDSAINCVLKLNDKVDVFVANNKRKPEQSEGAPPKKAKVDKGAKTNGSTAAKQTSPAKQSTSSATVPGSPAKGAVKAQDKTQPPKVHSHKGEGKKAENGGQKRKHEEIAEKSPEDKSNDNNVKADDGNMQGKPDNKAKQADNKKAKQGQPNAGKSAKSNHHQEKHDKNKKKKGNQAEQNKHKKPEHKTGEKTKQNKQASKTDKKPNANQKKQASLVEKAEPKADNKIEQKTAQKKQKAEPKPEEEKDVTPRELTMNQEEFNLNREGQADGGHTKKTKYQQKEGLQDESEPEPFSDMTVEATTAKSKTKKHKAEKHQKHSHDLSASAAAEVHTESKKHKKNKKNKKKKEEKEMHRKHSHDLSATAPIEEQTQIDTTSQKKKEKKQKKKEEKARRKSKDLTADSPLEQPLPMDTKLEKEEKAKKHSQAKITASDAMTPPAVEAAPKKHKAEKKRKSSLLPIASFEQDVLSVEPETTVPVAAEIASGPAIHTQNEDKEPADEDNFISALFPEAGSASSDTTITPPTADVPEETTMSPDAETESSPEVEATVTPTIEEPSFSNGADSGSDIEEEDPEATVTPDNEEPSFSQATDHGANSDVAEEEVNFNEVEEAEETNVAVSEELPDILASNLPISSMEDTPEPDVDDIEMQPSPVVESRELSFEPQASSTPIMIDSPSTNSVHEMEIETQLEQNTEASSLEQDVMKDEGSTVEQDDDVSVAQVEESEEVISSQAILPASGISTPTSQLDIQSTKEAQEDPESSSAESSSDDDDDDTFGFGAFTKSEADNQEQPDGGYLQTTINILEDISNESAKPVDVKAVEAATELRKVCDEEFKTRLTRAIKNGGETVKSGKEMQQLQAAQLGDEDSEDHPTSGLLPGFMSKSRAPTLSEIYANSQRYIYKSIHGRSPPPSPSRR
ncbi:hypothetical protein K450DRAFT_248003 [Umbelopsis ramanniana AG]|uniref:Uncharacterized protein n=1 Tax=Umbelopsis ramanniana AG TaxID=1314678 RepID=A0AAD5E7N7_UMBRA|nr:uncharacterized protein K450DRAFT_248003 [Umbelopsis ramanniana AG]KAI8578262.1 hypothetical protein K450DRAFT_248003 [Umbelopsis ramanniana AG]